MKVIVKEDAKVLVPNNEHQNFTESNNMIEQGTQLKGVARIIKGKRRGQEFDYKVFVTENDEILYLNKVEPMKNVTEVTLGADGEKTPTTVNLKQAEMFSRAKLIGVAIGGTAGYLLARKKKVTMKKAVVFVVAGALLGYAGAYIVDRNRKITVKPSK